VEFWQTLASRQRLLLAGSEYLVGRHKRVALRLPTDQPRTVHHVRGVNERAQVTQQGDQSSDQRLPLPLKTRIVVLGEILVMKRIGICLAQLVIP
jgi:hypothetical protein